MRLLEKYLQKTLASLAIVTCFISINLHPAYAQTSQLSGPPGDGGTEGSSCSNPIDFYYGQEQQINFSEDQQTACIRFDIVKGLL